MTNKVISDIPLEVNDLFRPFKIYTNKKKFWGNSNQIYLLS